MRCVEGGFAGESLGLRMPVEALGSDRHARRLTAGGCALVLAIGVLLCIAASAFAAVAPPPNDNRADATGLGSLRQTVHGTTVGATTESNEPVSDCATTSGSVWYSLSVGSSPPDRIGVKLEANGNLDAVLDVYQRQRSQNSQVDCLRTDTNGRAALAFKPAANTTYLFRVAQLSNSVAGTFSLNAFALAAPPSPPGRRLGARGADGVLDGTLATTAAYSMRLDRRDHVQDQPCQAQPGLHAAQDLRARHELVRRRVARRPVVCGVPPVHAARQRPLELPDRRRLEQPRHAALRPARRAGDLEGDGARIFLPNYAHYKGFLRGNVIDDVRLFRFDVTQRSDLVLFLMAASDAPFDLKLLNDQGRYLQCNCGSSGEETIRRQIPPGRYFVVVQAHDFGWGPFTLYRQSRLITHVNVTFDGTGYEQVAPGSVTRLAAHVTPAVDGPVTIEVESFDPVERWQFYRDYHVSAVNGLAEIPFRPPHVGRWRARCRSTARGPRAPPREGPHKSPVAVSLP